MRSSAFAQTQHNPPTAPTRQSDQITSLMLGDFSVSVNGVAIDAARWKHKHPRLLWQMLCLAPGHRVSRDEAAEALWPQAGVQASSNRLYHALHTLRGILGEAGRADARRWVRLQGGTISLQAELPLDLDVKRFAQALVVARACEGHDALAHLEHARAIHRGALALPSDAGEWFAAHRMALLRDRVWVLEQLARHLRADDRIGDAIQALEELVRAEPSNEAAHRGLMEIYHAQDRPDLMAQQYAACSRFLRRDLGVEPSAATRHWVERIGERASRARRDAAPATSAVRPRFIAQPHTAPLLGREAELDELRQWLLLDKGPRLITIAAAGGVGKTRLAAALAEQVQHRFADGVCFVTLGEVQRASLLDERVCQALGLTSQQPSADQAICRALADKHTLLVLDRFEHLLPAAPQLTRWLQAAPKLSIVVTSQCSLKSRAERVYELQPLLTHSPQAAVELFVRTARRVGADVDALHDESLILGLCGRVGGNALAIELAAAQLACVPVGDLSAALADAPLRVLAGQPPDGESRHASLEATIAWSCSLLTPAEAAALTLASVFVGDFSAEDVQAILGDLFEADLLQNALRRLMERHLLVGSIGESNNDSRRFAMLDAVRAFARREALTDSRWAQVQRHHAWHFHRLAGTAWQGVSEGRTGDVRSAFQAAAADIEQSLRWMREHAPAEDHLRGCWQRAVLLMTFGSLREAIDSLREATRVDVGSTGERVQSAWCHYVLSRAEVLAGRSQAAMRPLRAARSLAKSSSEEALLGRIDRHLARLALGQLRLGAARRLIEKSVSRSQRLERLDLVSYDHGNLSLCFSMSGDYAGASAMLELAIEYALRARDSQLMLLAMLGVVTVETALGRLDRAQDALRECMPLLNAGYSEYLGLYVVLIRGELAFEQAQFDDAHRQFSSALEHCRTKLPERALVARLWHDFLLVESGRPLEAVTLLGLSDRELAFDCDFGDFFCRALNYQLRLQADCQDWPAAQATLARLEPLARKSGNPLWISWLAQSAAVAAHDLGRGELAGELLARARALQLEHGIFPTPRQTSSWERQQARQQHDLPRCCASAADVLAAMLERLRLDLGQWNRKPPPLSRREKNVSAHTLPRPIEGVPRDGAERRVA